MISNVQIIASVLGFIAIFLYAIRELSEIFENLFEERTRQMLDAYTSTFFKSFLVGIIATLIMDSSSAVMIITIILINSGNLNLKKGIGIALGANIGTTFQSQLFAFDFLEYSFILLVIGFFYFFMENGKNKTIFNIMFLIGLLFFSIFQIEQVVANPEVFELLQEFLKEEGNSHYEQAMIGGLFTVILQSSGAVVGIVISLAKENVVGLPIALAIMMGAELGTTSNVLFATIGGSRQSLYLAIFNVLFNIFAISIGLIFFHQFTDLIVLLFGNFSVARQVANGHILFNVLAVILLLPFSLRYASFFDDLIVEKRNKQWASDTQS